MPRVSVVMPVYNSQKYLAEAIDSILAQTFGDFELLCVDDGSSDNSAAIIQSYAQRDSRVKLIQHEQNLGSSSARQTGLRRAQGEYVAMCDSDDTCRHERLEKQLAFMRANPAIGVLGGQALKTTPDMQPLAPHTVPQRHSLIVLHLFLGLFIVGGTAMIRREQLEAVGGYDERIRFAEDLDLWTRFAMQGGVRFHNLPDVLIKYRIHQQSQTRSHDPATLAQARIPRLNMLEQLWGQRSEATVDRFERLETRQTQSLVQWLLLNRDLRRLVKALLRENWVDQADEKLLWETVVMRGEEVGPRLWRKFGYWRRYRLPRFFPDPYDLY